MLGKDVNSLRQLGLYGEGVDESSFDLVRARFASREEEHHAGASKATLQCGRQVARRNRDALEEKADLGNPPGSRLA